MEVSPDSDEQLPSRLAELAERQHGVLARWQLETEGLRRGAIDRRIARAQFLPLHRGVYAVGHKRLSYRGQWMAAVLACGPEAVLSHHAAAALWDLRPVPQSKIDVTAPGKRKHAGIRCHVGPDLHEPDRTQIDGIPVTGLERTYLDYAEQATPRQLTAALEAGQRRNILNLRTLQLLIDGSPGRRGLKPLTAAMSDLSDDPPWTQSPLEDQFRHLIRATGLPTPRMNVLVEGELVDCVWDSHRLVVELDGYGYHQSRRSFEEDRRRDAKLQAAGWRVVRFTRRRIERDAAGVIADLRRLLCA
jgi:very-short-patch-repair endonuclease